VNTEQKLDILAQASRFDLACACKFKDEPGRIRGPEGRWIYPAVLGSKGKVFLLKTLQSNACVNDCSYCPFNNTRDIARCTIAPDDLAHIFMQLREAGRVSGLFLSSGVSVNADSTMERMLTTVELLRRKHQFRGYVHLKILPGASGNAIDQAMRLATRVSVNIETPTAERLGKLSHRKRFHEDIIATMKAIKQYRDNHKTNCSQTTQFVVGAANETDREIVRATDRLYQKLEINRVYFSAYQKPDFDSGQDNEQLSLFPDLALPNKPQPNNKFVREHRLYQVDFLLRKYKFTLDEIYFDKTDNLSLKTDPKSLWAQHHPEFFPVDVNRADYEQLMRVPGIGPVGARRIVKARRESSIKGVEELSSLGIRAQVAGPYLKLPMKKLPLLLEQAF